MPLMLARLLEHAFDYLLMMCRRISLIAVTLLLFVLLAAEAAKDGLVDPYAWDYDRETQTNRGTDSQAKLGEFDCSSDEMKTACAKCGYDVAEGGLSPEKARCPDDAHLLRHTARAISQHFQDYPDTDSILLTLSSYQREKLLKYVNGQDTLKVDVKDMLSSSWSIPPGATEPYDILGLTSKEVIFGCMGLSLFISIFLMVLTFHVSLSRVVFALCFTAIIMSFFWSYGFLYQTKIAERMADDALRQEYHEMCQSSEKGSIFGTIRGFFKRDDACKKYFRDHQVDVVLEVLPVHAITHTLGAVMTSFSHFFGVSLGELSGGFLGSLSFTMWIPATLFLLVFVVAILAVYLYCGSWRGTRRREREVAGRIDGRPEARQDALQDPDDARNRVEEARMPRYALRDGLEDANAHRRRGDRYAPDDGGRGRNDVQQEQEAAGRVDGRPGARQDALQDQNDARIRVEEARMPRYALRGGLEDANAHRRRGDRYTPDDGGRSWNDVQQEQEAAGRVDGSPEARQDALQDQNDARNRVEEARMPRYALRDGTNDAGAYRRGRGDRYQPDDGGPSREDGHGDSRREHPHGPPAYHAPERAGNQYDKNRQNIGKVEAVHKEETERRSGEIAKYHKKIDDSQKGGVTKDIPGATNVADDVGTQEVQQTGGNKDCDPTRADGEEGLQEPERRYSGGNKGSGEGVGVQAVEELSTLPSSHDVHTPPEMSSERFESGVNNNYSSDDDFEVIPEE